MATTAQWIEGARLRTLPNAIAPVLVGVGASIGVGGFSAIVSILALVVSLSLIVGVNFANDYSDGIRGTDSERVGPLRLVGSGVAAPQRVLAAALGSFAVAAVAGLVLIVVTGHWWLLAVGAAAIAAAWFYTGGAKPYGYSGLGEPAVFLFFGLVAVLGTMYAQADTVHWQAVLASIAVGAFSAAVLIANNLRDVHTDPGAGKRTLAVRLGETNTRRTYLVVVIVPFVVSLILATSHPWVLLALASAPLIVRCVRHVSTGADGLALIPVLRDTALTMLVWSLCTGAGLAL